MEKTEQSSQEIPVEQYGPIGIVSGGEFRFAEASTRITPWHIHPHDMLIVLRTGQMGFVIQNEFHFISPGMMIHLPANYPHYAQSLEANVFAWIINIPSEKRVKQFCDEPKIFKTNSVIEGLCERIVNANVRSKEDKHPLIRRLVLSFLDSLGVVQPMRHLAIPFPKRQTLCEIALAIILDPQSNTLLDVWAKKVGMSRRSLTDHFLKETGLSYVDWRKRVKLQSSLFLLAEGKPIKEIAHALGFSSSSSFIQVFREQFHVAPKTYLAREAASLGYVKKKSRTSRSRTNPK